MQPRKKAKKRKKKKKPQTKTLKMDRNNKLEILYFWQGLVQYVTVKQPKEEENIANSHKIKMDLM